MLAMAESKDQGKPLWLSKNLEIPRSITNFRYFAGLIEHWHETASTEQAGSSMSFSMSVPVGVAGLISPWNLPLYLLTWKIAPAIAGKDKYRWGTRSY